MFLLILLFVVFCGVMIHFAYVLLADRPVLFNYACSGGFVLILVMICCCVLDDVGALL